MRQVKEIRREQKKRNEKREDEKKRKKRDKSKETIQGEIRPEKTNWDKRITGNKRQEDQSRRNTIKRDVMRCNEKRPKSPK